MPSTSNGQARASGSGSGSNGHMNRNGNRNGIGNGSMTQTQNGTRKRRRYETVEEMFEGQTPEEVERLTASYRALQDQADETKSDLANKTMKDLRRTIKSGEELFRNTKDTGVAALDARLIQSTVESAVAMARKNRVAGGAFNIDEFLIRIQGVLGLDRAEREDMSPSTDDELDETTDDRPSRRARNGRLGDWEKLGWLAAKHTKRVPGVEFMYGPLAVEHNKRVTQRRVRRRSVGVEQRPQEVHNQPRQRGEKPPVDDMVNNVFTVQKLLEERDQGDGINFLELVINPDDYGQTVENIFYASFLIKEGSAGIQVDDDGLVVIRNENNRDMDAAADAPKNQAVMELDMDTWREAIELFNIKKPIIPHRDYGLQARPGEGTWYS